MSIKISGQTALSVQTCMPFMVAVLTLADLFWKIYRFCYLKLTEPCFPRSFSRNDWPDLIETSLKLFACSSFAQVVNTSHLQIQQLTYCSLSFNKHTVHRTQFARALSSYWTRLKLKYEWSEMLDVCYKAKLCTPYTLQNALHYKLHYYQLHHNYYLVTKDLLPLKQSLCPMKLTTVECMMATLLWKFQC